MAYQFKICWQYDAYLRGLRAWNWQSIARMEPRIINDNNTNKKWRSW